MKPHCLKSQAGYMLLLTLLALMGLGGVVLAGFSQEAKQQVDHERYLHNKRVLEEAKQALLMYAYRYPETALAFGTPTIRGPGRLPCPDTDDSGTPNPVADCESGANGIVGRFPWNADGMEFYDVKDASDERLWYAVSKNLANFDPSDVINSDTPGTISIHDQTGSLLYDSAVAGVAVVIIAPGPAIDRGGVAQLRQTGAQQIDPLNYLDLFGALDNADFVNDSTNGFVLGPVENMTTGTTLVNDQIILITTEELVAVAEKATMQAYQRAMLDYSNRLENDFAAAPAPWNRYYPWLYNYAVNNLDSYPSDPVFATEQAGFLSNIGRVPSIYSYYFTEADSQAIESEFEFDFTLDYPVTPIGYDQVIPVITTGNFNFNAGAQHDFNAITTLPQTISFSDIADVVGLDGRISATAITSQTHQVELWFWDELELGPPTGIWTACPIVGGVASDCNRDSVGNPTPGSATNDADSHVLRVIAEIDFPAGIPVDFDMDYTAAPTITATSAANGGSHATIQAIFAGGDVIDVPVTLSYEIDRFYSASFDIQESGTLIVDDLTTGNLTLGMRYYPELPAWVFDNGWHNSMQMAYALRYRPDQIPANCAAGVDCLQINKLGGINNDKISLLVIAGEHDWLDEGADNFANDLLDVFDVENHNIDPIFDIRADNGNDKILVIDEL